jgi:hypothetical protein
MLTGNGSSQEKYSWCETGPCAAVMIGKGKLLQKEEMETLEFGNRMDSHCNGIFKMSTNVSGSIIFFSVKQCLLLAAQQ